MNKFSKLDCIFQYALEIQRILEATLEPPGRAVTNTERSQRSREFIARNSLRIRDSLADRQSYGDEMKRPLKICSTCHKRYYQRWRNRNRELCCPFCGYPTGEQKPMFVSGEKCLGFWS